MKSARRGDDTLRACPKRRARIAAAILLAVPLFAPLTGCWPFNRGPSAQQQFFDALNRGDAVTANQIWFAMSPKDREKVMRGEGVGSRPSAEDIQAAIARHKPGDTSPIVIGPEGGSAAGVWKDLPKLLGSSPIPTPAP